MRVFVAILILFFIPSMVWSGPPKWVTVKVEGLSRKWVRVHVDVDRERFRKILSQGSSAYQFICEVKVKKRRRFFPDRVVKHKKVERRLKKDEVRGFWVLERKKSSESIYKSKGEAIPFFLSGVVFKLKKKYFERKGYSVKGRIMVTPRIPRFPLSRLFSFGDKVDSGWFKIKFKPFPRK